MTDPTGWSFDPDSGTYRPPIPASAGSHSHLESPAQVQQVNVRDGAIEVRDASNVLRIKVGRDGTDFDVKVYDAAGANPVKLSTLAFGIVAAVVAPFQGTTSTTFVDLATVGPSVTLTVGASGRVWLMGGAFAHLSDTGATAEIGLSTDGAAPPAPPGVAAFEHNMGGSGGMSVSFGRVVTGLSAGSHTFKLQYLTSLATVTASFEQRWILAQPF